VHRSFGWVNGTIVAADLRALRRQHTTLRITTLDQLIGGFLAVTSLGELSLPSGRKGAGGQ
jgi:hypothetical protein